MSSIGVQSNPAQQQYVLYNNEYVLPAFGLNNTGSICWFNSILQSLFSLSCFNQKMLELGSKGAFANNELAKQYVKALREIPNAGPETSLQDKFSKISANVLLGFGIELQKHNKTLDIRSQEGAMNGLCLFIEMINNEEINNIIFNKYIKTIDCEFCNKQDVSKEVDLSPIISIYRNSQVINDESFTDYIKRRTSNVCDFRCENCGKTMKNALRFERIRRLSEIIVVAFAYTADFPKYFPETMSFLNIDGNMMRYEAISQIEHSGIYDINTHVSSGHYYAKCKRGVNKENCYLFNDLSVSKCDLNLSRNTHIVFYQMMKIDEPNENEKIKYKTVLDKLKQLD